MPYTPTAGQPLEADKVTFDAGPWPFVEGSHGDLGMTLDDFNRARDCWEALRKVDKPAQMHVITWKGPQLRSNPYVPSDWPKRQFLCVDGGAVPDKMTFEGVGKAYDELAEGMKEVAYKPCRLPDVGTFGAHAPPSPLYAPIDMVLYCPNCGKQHIDESLKNNRMHAVGCNISCGVTGRCSCGFDSLWDNPPHRSHLCHDCGTIWRPCDFATNGVASIKTEGKADTWPVNGEDGFARSAQNPLLEKVRELKGKLDICKRYALGEIHDPCGLAADYGGTGWEQDPACLAVGNAMAKKLPRKLEIPPPPAEMHDVVYAEGWNQCCDTFFGGLPAQEPVVITLTEKRVSLTDEQERALCEAYCNTASDEHFKARPQLDSQVNRRIFYAGHRKAWVEYAAAHTITDKKD